LPWRFSSVSEIVGIASFDMTRYSTTKVITSQTTWGAKSWKFSWGMPPLSAIAVLLTPATRAAASML
jgi:hypothetical protein